MNVYYKYAKGEKKLYNGSHTSPFLRFTTTQYIYIYIYEVPHAVIFRGQIV